MRLFKIVALLAISFSLGMAVPPPDNSSPDRVKIQDTIITEMSNVDDVGLVMVWNGDGARTVSKCEWSSGGNHGYAKDNVSKYLTKGTNYIVFVLYNKVYRGGMFFSGGKWSYSFSLRKNGSIIWNKDGYKRQNDAEIKYWKVFKADVNSNGKVSLTDSIPSKELRILSEGLGQLEQKLYQNTGVATPF